jgi:predicted transcriptional regulator
LRVGWLHATGFPRARLKMDITRRGRRCDAVPRETHTRRYNRVILSAMKTAISLPDDTFRRVDRAAKRLGVSRSEFFARAAESWLAVLEEEDITEAINHALRGVSVDHEFTDAAAAALAAADSQP